MTSDVDGWRTNLLYSYAVDSEYYSGVHSLPVSSATEADQLVSLLKSKKIAVRYSPKNPRISIVFNDDQTSIQYWQQ